jgi:hypothetical protein
MSPSKLYAKWLMSSPLRQGFQGVWVIRSSASPSLLPTIKLQPLFLASHPQVQIRSNERLYMYMLQTVRDILRLGRNTEWLKPRQTIWMGDKYQCSNFRYLLHTGCASLPVYQWPVCSELMLYHQYKGMFHFLPPLFFAPSYFTPRPHPQITRLPYSTVLTPVRIKVHTKWFV